MQHLFVIRLPKKRNDPEDEKSLVSEILRASFYFEKQIILV